MVNLGLLQTCTFNQWSPVIGDPTVAGWLTVMVYLTCAGLAVSVIVCLRGSAGPERFFWLMICVLMLMLAVNKQLDLQSLLTALGRCISQQQGWYAERRAFQAQFIAWLLAALTIILGIGVYAMRQHLKRNGLALLGLAVVTLFVAGRAASFHHLDAIHAMWLDAPLYNVWLENTGPVLIALNAATLALWTGRRA